MSCPWLWVGVLSLWLWVGWALWLPSRGPVVLAELNPPLVEAVPFVTSRQGNLHLCSSYCGCSSPSSPAVAPESTGRDARGHMDGGFLPSGGGGSQLAQPLGRNQAFISWGWAAKRLIIKTNKHMGENQSKRDGQLCIKGLQPHAACPLPS